MRNARFCAVYVFALEENLEGVFACVTDFWTRRHNTTLSYSLMVYSNNSRDTSPKRPNKA